MAAFLRTHAELNMVAQFWQDEANPHRADLATMLNRALDDLSKGHTNERLNRVRFALQLVLKDFLDEIINSEFFSVSHFLKDASGFQVDLLPSLIMGENGYRFTVFFEASPDESQHTVQHVMVRRHEAISDVAAELTDVDYNHSANHLASEEIHFMRKQIQQCQMDSISETYVKIAGQYARLAVLEHVFPFEMLGDALWIFVAR